MVASMIDNKILDPTVTEWFIRDRKQNISLAFVKQSYFPKTDNFRLSSTYYFLKKIQIEETSSNRNKSLMRYCA